MNAAMALSRSEIPLPLCKGARAVRMGGFILKR